MLVLVLDDDPSVLMAIQMLLESKGYTTITASSCEEAFVLVSTHRPCLVLSDINMPGCGGFQLLEQLQAAGLNPEIPLIFISAMARAQDIEAGLKAGAKDYITKPFSPARLLDSVSAHALIQ